MNIHDVKTVIQKKVCLLGDFSVGKTSLVQRFVYDRFDERYLSTIGVKISRKEIILSDERTIQLLIWDLAGGEDYSGTQANYLQGAAGAFLVCDLTRKDTLDSIQKYADQLHEIRAGAPVVMIANKSDLTAEREIEIDDLQMVKDTLDAPLLITSAKTGDGVEQAFRNLTKRIT